MIFHMLMALMNQAYLHGVGFAIVAAKKFNPLCNEMQSQTSHANDEQQDDTYG